MCGGAINNWKSPALHLENRVEMMAVTDCTAFTSKIVSLNALKTKRGVTIATAVS